MNIEEPEGAATMYADMARAYFEDQGELPAVLVLHGREKSATCFMAPTEDMPAAYGRTLAMGANIYEPIFVITVTEAWIKSYELADESEVDEVKDSVQRGDMEKMALAGDLTVKTALMTIAWTMDPTEAVSVIDVVQHDKTYEREIRTGEAEGHMSACLIAGWKHGLTLPKPPVPMPDEMGAMLLSFGGDVSAVAFEILDTTPLN